MLPRGGCQVSEPAWHTLAVPNFLTLTVIHTNPAERISEDQGCSFQNLPRRAAIHFVPYLVGCRCVPGTALCISGVHRSLCGRHLRPMASGHTVGIQAEYTVGEAGRALEA